MLRLTRVPKHWLLVAAMVLIAAGAATVAYAQGNNTVVACVNNTNGNARVVAAAPFAITGNAVCSQNETQVTWNIAGPQGPQGPMGPAGPPGTPGSGGAPADKVVTLAQNVTLHPGEQTSLPWIDTSNYNGYRLYARVTPFTPTPKIRLRVYDAPTATGEGGYGASAFLLYTLCSPTPPTPCNTAGWYGIGSDPPTPGPPYVAWTNIPANASGHYPKLLVSATNFGSAGDPDATVSLYLLMYKD